METLEIEGKSIDEAIEKACRDFGVSRDKLNIEILSDGSSGFLGLMGARKARIKAGLLSIDETLDMTPAPPQPETTEEMPEAGITPAAFDRPLAADGDGAGLGERAKAVLEGILAHMGIAAPVSIEETEESILLNIKGDGGGLIIGRRGQNLDAIQYIVNKSANRSVDGRKMIIIDTEAYRKRREESLVTLAEKLGEKVKKTKKAVTVSHMNAHDRRIIHMALQNDESLTTRSRGEGEYRKIVIIPAKKN
jgi:spoIIIJ-associated protein